MLSVLKLGMISKNFISPVFAFLSCFIEMKCTEAGRDINDMVSRSVRHLYFFETIDYSAINTYNTFFFSWQMQNAFSYQSRYETLFHLSCFLLLHVNDLENTRFTNRMSNVRLCNAKRCRMRFELIFLCKLCYTICWSVEEPVVESWMKNPVSEVDESYL